MGHISNTLTLVMAGLFLMALVTFAINFAADNHSKISLADDPDFPGARSEVEGNVTVFYSDVGIITNATQQMTISTQTEATEGGTAFKVGPGTALAMAYPTLRASYKKIFGPDANFGLFFTILISSIGFITAMYIYKVLAGRSPD